MLITKSAALQVPAVRFLFAWYLSREIAVAERLNSEFHLRQSFALFDELNQAALGWNLDFLQLGPAQGRHYLE